MGRTTVVLASVIFVGVVFAGCVHDSWHCSEHFGSASWIEPGLFEELTNASTSDPSEWHGRLPFTHNGTEILWGQDHVLNSVTWHLEIGNSGQEGHSRALIRVVPSSPPGSDLENRGRYLEEMHITMVTTHSTADTKWRTLLASFLDHTGIVVDDREGWIESVLATRRLPYGASEPTPVRIGYASVPGALKLEGLYDRLGGQEEEQASGRLSGTLGMRNPRLTDDNSTTWVFGFRPGVRSVALPGPESVELVLEVDAGDLVRVELPPGPGGNETAHREWIATAFHEAGFPGPTFERFEMSAVVC